jgi:curli biogenesis system outer membrane secretion channel CsgG
MRVPTLLALPLALVIGACAPAAQVSRGGGAEIAVMRALDAQARPRVAVAAVIDRSNGDATLERTIAALNRRLPGDALLTPQVMLDGVRDLLTTELFMTDRFIVLERAALDTVLAEQVFGVDAGSALELPAATLEGADYLVLGAITAINPGLDGGALPIPLPLGDDDFGILKMRAARGYIAMDLRIVDARSARVLHATAVEGRYWRLAADFTGYFDVGHDYVKIPGLLQLFRNTPLEAALQRMSIAAVARIAEASSAHPAQAEAIPGPDFQDKP